MVVSRGLRAGLRTVPAADPAPQSFRPELQGLRGVAVALVVIYHVWLNRVSGGVDVFFVISGFLLTGQLARAAARGPLELPRRWSRTLVRLLPSMVVVLVATMLACMVVLPEGRWPQTLREVVAAALFVENWQMVADSVDYAAQNNMASVAQQFWSLSIQGQFFLIWPLMAAVVALAARGDGARIRAYLITAVSAVLVTSLAYSVELTITDQPMAYFHTLTRLWEFAIGGLLALCVDLVVLARRTRVVLGWIGIVGLLVCGLVLNVGAVFPGVAALWPTGCAVLVLLAGTTGDRRGVDRFLASRPLQYFGGISFPLYLWHWPILVLYLVARDRVGVSVTTGVAIICGSVVLAVLTHHLVEQPMLKRSIGVAGGYRLGMAGLVCVLLVAAGWQVDTDARAAAPGVAGDAWHPGALALAGVDARQASLVPAPVTVYEDWVRIEHWNCAPLARFPMDMCTQPVDFQPHRRIVVVGDSHIQQLSGALVEIARNRHWQLIAIVRGACPFSTASEVNPDDADCLAWNEAAAAEIADLRPDAVVTLATRDARVGLTEQLPPGFIEQWRRLDALGIPVLAVRDNPRFDFSVPDCVEQRGRGALECGAARDAIYAHQPPWMQIADLPPNVAFLDIANAICDPTQCPPEIGNVLVYLDNNHVTAAYSSSMAGLLEADVVAKLDP